MTTGHDLAEIQRTAGLDDAAFAEALGIPLADLETLKASPEAVPEAISDKAYAVADETVREFT